MTERTRFVFMLTRDDRTVPEARGLIPEIRASGVRHVGAKDIGLPVTELQVLFGDLRNAGFTTYLEVVADSSEAMLKSAQNALDLRPDYVVGGTEVEGMAGLLAGSGIKFFPYVGRVVDHPSLLRGTIAEIVANAQSVEAAGVDGINLLAYRYDGEVISLIEAVTRAVHIPVLCAGSIDSEARVRVIHRLGVWGFTAGTAVLNRAFVPGSSVGSQLRRVLELAEAD